MAYLQRVTVVVPDYDEAIGYFVGVLGFELVEDSPAVSDAGAAKRWVVVRPAGGETEILLARADGDAQLAAVGQQTGGRVAFFLRVDDFDAAYARIAGAGGAGAGGGGEITPPRDEPYGRVAVFTDIAGNRWDLLGPAPDQAGRSE
jgi:catechol 2,3-dioxygenase-like lactoylglutathione lyase family enzyme